MPTENQESTRSAGYAELIKRYALDVIPNWHTSAYDASLQAFSRPLMALVEYDLDEQGRMVVTNDVRRWYAYPDMTPQVEALFRFIDRTIGRELVDELTFIENYDRTKRAIQEIVDLPDRRIDLFICGN